MLEEPRKNLQKPITSFKLQVPPNLPQSYLRTQSIFEEPYKKPDLSVHLNFKFVHHLLQFTKFMSKHAIIQKQ